MQLTRNFRRPAAQRGSFLVEAMVASLLILVGVVGTMDMQANFARASVDTSIRMRASVLATSLISIASMQPTAAMCLTIPQVGACSSTPMITESANWVAQYNAIMPTVSGIDTSPQVSLDATQKNFNIVIRWQVKGDSVVNSLTYTAGL